MSPQWTYSYSPADTWVYQLLQKGKKRSVDTKTILSFGLASSNALRPLCNRYPSEPDPQCIIEIAQLEALLTTQEHCENFVCRVCTKFRHKQKFCNRYFCRICRKFVPGHLTPHCKDLCGWHILHQGPSSECFYDDICRLEAAYDQAAACWEQEREENALEAAKWLANIDFDPVWDTNQDEWTRWFHP